MARFSKKCLVALAGKPPGKFGSLLEAILDGSKINKTLVKHALEATDLIVFQTWKTRSQWPVFTLDGDFVNDRTWLPIQLYAPPA